jgi:hypothetical protein
MIVIGSKPLGEGRELALDIGGLLCLQLRRAELMVAGTVTGGARRNAACGIPGKGQANGRIFFSKGMPGLKTLADKGRQAVGAACELSPDIDRTLRRQAASARYTNRAGRRPARFPLQRLQRSAGAATTPTLSFDRSPSIARTSSVRL